jgi:DNA-binding NarL/FixJ family response regulator
VVVDDHDLARRTIIRVLRQAADVEVVAEAANGNEALAVVRDAAVDVVLLDVSMPVMGGLETLRQLKVVRPELALLVLSMHPEDPYALRFLREGAHGYMTKERAGDELIGALRTVHAGRRYASPALLDKLGSDWRRRLPAPRRVGR